VEIELIVVDDSSTDATADIAARAGAVVVPATCRHIAAARNAGARKARGSALVFVDADTTIDASVLRGVLSALRSGAAGGGSGVRFDEPVPAYGRIMLAATAWMFARLKLAAGCFMFCTRTAFDGIGGFNEDVFAAEEIFFSRALRRQGRVVILREKVTTSARKLRTHSAREILGAMTRIGLKGRKGLKSRSNLGLWYGPRR
jgi:glycosyltransferase involved in cell wall biosynthesis